MIKTKRKIASLDIGTNSIILLILETDPKNKEEPTRYIGEYLATTRLGEDLSETKVLSKDAMQRTNIALKELLAIVREESILEKDLIVSATSAVRDAQNSTEFLLKCNSSLDIFPQVLSGKEEARLTYLGALAGIKEDNVPTVLFDIGGGSTEIAYGTKNRMVDAHSFNFGGIKSTEMFKLNSNYVRYIINKKKLEQYINNQIEHFSTDFQEWLNKNPNPRVIISGGTATTYAAITNKIYVYDRNLINGIKSDLQKLISVKTQLERMSPKKRKDVPGMDADRADIMPAGLIILLSLLEKFELNDFEITVDGLRTGVIEKYLIR